jgi:AraC-like DNA-binding protein
MKRSVSPTVPAAVSARVLIGVATFMASSGLDAESIFSSAGLDSRMKFDLSETIPFFAYGRLLERAGEVSHNGAFGVDLATALPGAMNGLSHHMTMNAPTIREALRVRTRFFTLFTTAFSVELDHIDGADCYCWRQPATEPWPGTHVVGNVFALLVDQIRNVSHRDWQPESTVFGHAEPGHADTYRRVFGDVLFCGDKRTRMVFEPGFLDQSIPSADPALYADLLEAGSRLLGPELDLPLIVIRTRNYLERALPAQSASEPLAAASLGMSLRSFQRELADAGTTYRHVKDGLRVKMATDLLSKTDMRLSEIAFTLGFSELSSFSRSSRTWFGMPASQFRRQATR